MNKEFIPYEQALELKELGFDEQCFGYYVGNELITSINDIFNTTEILIISAPLYRQAFRWFREKHGLALQFKHYQVPMWTFEILEFTNIKITPNTLVSETSKMLAYEEAELAGLKKMIEIVKNKQAVNEENRVSVIEIKQVISSITGTKLTISEKHDLAVAIFEKLGGKVKSYINEETKSEIVNKLTKKWNSGNQKKGRIQDISIG
jgi:hypothetical protein